jgi:hypothetical protein
MDVHQATQLGWNLDWGTQPTGRHLPKPCAGAGDAVLLTYPDDYDYYFYYEWSVNKWSRQVIRLLLSQSHQLEAYTPTTTSSVCRQILHEVVKETISRALTHRP